MGNALVTLILVTVVMVSALGLVSSSVSAFDMLADSSKEVQDQACDRGRTSIHCDEAHVDGAEVSVRITNNGGIPLYRFEDWDVIIQYHDVNEEDRVVWLPYSESAGEVNQWTIEGIYFGLQSESIEPGILNPGETAVIDITLSPAIGSDTTNLATVATNTGVSAQLVFGGND
ncbi:MAG: hypothetical protein JW846_07500 [Dehalococcoidia bacterium]|nr:hypothetical protein [Dehalococcoidia bacterium]